MSIAGIDPGLGGAIALIDDRVRVWDVPTFKVNVNGKERRRVNLHELAVLFELLADEVSLCVIEDVGPMPKDSPQGAFNFGFVAGALQALACRWKLLPVKPAVWKIQMGLGGQTKDASRRKASQLFPKFSHLWARAKDDGRAEAALLAYYGSRIK
jgi:crossover junction endodeoxyribonuclease RuvC